jgi:hypothetical protein
VPRWSRAGPGVQHRERRRPAAVCHRGWTGDQPPVAGPIPTSFSQSSRRPWQHRVFVGRTTSTRRFDAAGRDPSTTSRSHAGLRSVRRSARSTTRLGGARRSKWSSSAGAGMVLSSGINRHGGSAVPCYADAVSEPKPILRVEWHRQVELLEADDKSVLISNVMHLKYVLSISYARMTTDARNTCVYSL